MAKFTCKSTKHGWTAELTYVRPNTLDAPGWKKLVGRPSMDQNTLALKAWTVEAQRVVREEKTPELAQAKLDLWRYKGGTVPPIKDLRGMEFTKDQIAILSEDGTELINFTIAKK